MLRASTKASKRTRTSTRVDVCKRASSEDDGKTFLDGNLTNDYLEIELKKRSTQKVALGVTYFDLLWKKMVFRSANSENAAVHWLKG